MNADRVMVRFRQLPSAFWGRQIDSTRFRVKDLCVYCFGFKCSRCGVQVLMCDGAGLTVGCFGFFRFGIFSGLRLRGSGIAWVSDSELLEFGPDSQKQAIGGIAALDLLHVLDSSKLFVVGDELALHDVQCTYIHICLQIRSPDQV